MQRLRGVPVSPGYAEGTAVPLDPTAASPVPCYLIPPQEIDSEVLRLDEALERACQELERLEHRVLSELGYASSSIFTAHLALLRDPVFTDKVKQHIREQQVNAEQALDREITDFAAVLAAVENEYMRERAQDIRDVGRRVLRQLARGDNLEPPSLPPRSVIVARELLPSETFDLDRNRIAAIVTEEGGENSHGAILARALGIPAVTGVAGACNAISAGDHLLVDGQTGRITLMPTAGAMDSFTALKHDYDIQATAEAAAEQLDCVTLDGTRIQLLANINRGDEAALVGPHHLDGVGLFRTEFLYMDALEPPDCERQLQIYQQVLRTLEGRPLVVRTLDLGGDKLPPCGQREINPGFGWRGLRLALARPDLFKPQLKALAAAVGEGELGVMFPMVLGPGDLRRAIHELGRAARASGSGEMPRVGAMIETPSALFALPEILPQVDFVSLGTNDLTQFMLAADRDAAESLDSYSVLHPSVLRAIRQVVSACEASGRKLCVCGEAAGEPDIACLLVGLGVRELSMSPLRAAAVRFRLRSMRLSSLEKLAERALGAEEPPDVARLLKTLN